MHTSDRYDGDRLVTEFDRRRVLTPMVLVMLVIVGTDILFALDSNPAIFGLTQSVYLVFTATAFSLLGLRQLWIRKEEELLALLRGATARHGRQDPRPHHPVPDPDDMLRT